MKLTMVVNASIVVSLTSTVSSVALSGPKNCFLKTGLTPARRNLWAWTFAILQFASPSSSPAVKEMVYFSESPSSSSDGCSSMMWKVMSGANSEPGCRNCAQLVCSIAIVFAQIRLLLGSLLSKQFRWWWSVDWGSSCTLCIQLKQVSTLWLC